MIPRFHVNDHNKVTLSTAAMMRMQLPMIVFTLRNGRHQWQGITQRRPSMSCRAKQIMVSQMSMVMVPLTKDCLFLGMNDVISPPLPLEKNPRSEGITGSLRRETLMLFATANTDMTMENMAVATQKRFSTNTSARCTMPNTRKLSSHIYFCSIHIWDTNLVSWPGMLSKSLVLASMASGSA